MVKYYIKQEGQLVELQKPAPKCWVNIYPPFSHENIRTLAGELDIPFDFLIDSLDIDERSRFEREDDIELIVVKTPIVNEVENETDAFYITIPIGIILAKDIIVTISSYENPVIDWFLSDKAKRFDPSDKSKFVLNIFERNVYYFLYYLNEINSKRNIFETELHNSLKNKELLNLLNIEKSLVYFVTSIRSNELMMLKLKRLDFLHISKKEDEIDLFEDIMVDNSQALEMTNIYTNILSGTMDAFASIISNNLNNVMKRLTSVTIVLMVPTLVASFYGMNVHLPFEKDPSAFAFTLLISVLLSVLLVIVFLRKKWF
jgi:magnesium transporter